VQDVEDVFAKRWQLARDQHVDYSGNTTAFEPSRDQPADAYGVQAQLTTTMPQPLWEHSILETWLNAVAHAQDYIYIEDQYFRAPMLTDAILARMAEVPSLKLVVITKPINEWTDPGCAWTYRTTAQLKAALGDRFMLLQLRTFDTEVTWGIDETESRYLDMDTHSKILIVDDTFMSVGSANKNNRGVVYEGEMSLAVYDHDWVRDARRRIMDNLLGFEGGDVSDDWWDQLANEAAWNDWVSANWDAEGGDIDLDGDPLPDAYAPVGFVYSMDFPDVSECLFESVGPDQT
jgi:phosphatidylserine/phosphatidylglycerophosphate/cardiolipin synthase-like enzyme